MFLSSLFLPDVLDAVCWAEFLCFSTAFLSSLLVSSDFRSSVGSLMQALLEARETAFSNLTNQELRKSKEMQEGLNSA